MPFSHLLLALAVVAVWGTNFVVIKYGIAELPPLLMVTLRFAFSALPLLFIPRPAVSWRHLILYGVFIGGQFACLFPAMQSDISPGLASLLIQSQVFFTILLAALLLHERVRRSQLLGIAIATLGFAVIAWNSFRLSQNDVTPLGLLLILMGALSWASANLISRRIGKVNMLGFMVWSSLFAVPPVALVGLLLEGPALWWQALPQASGAAWAATLWQAIGNTLFGYAAWGWLLARHAAGVVTPMALLVPVFGMGASALLLAETLQSWKLMAAALVIGGLALNVLASRQPQAQAQPAGK